MPLQTLGNADPATGAASRRLPRRRTLTLVANAEVGPSIHVLTFALENGDDIEFVPGQYVTFYLPKGGRSITRSYSIFSSSYQHNQLSLLIKEVPGGFGSPLLCGLSPVVQPKLTVLAPLGKFVLQPPSGRSVVFVATGVGIAPFVPMLERLHNDFSDTPTTLFWGNRYVDGVVHRSELDLLARQWQNFRFVPVLSRPPADGSWSGAVGHVEAQVESDFPSLRTADVYLCGANQMVNQMQELALALGAPKERVFVDRWGTHSG